jgi:hypothetical protein
MSLPGETSNDRRAVPRHIRDGEHDMLDEAMRHAPAPRRAARAGLLLWICVAVLAAGAVGLWIALRA